jgi:ribosomal protein S18 acetylase RimI-like enzyme
VIVPAASNPVLFARAVRQFRSVDGGNRFLAAEGTVAFVATDHDEVAGWCWGQHMVRPDETSMIYLHELDVDERFRRRGVGRDLVVSFINAGRALGATKMFLTTGATNEPARALYEQLGGGLAEQGPTVSYWFQLTP